MPQTTPPDLEGNEATARQLKVISEHLASIYESNERIENLLRILAQPVIHSALAGVFTNSKQIRAYELSDGTRSTRQIGALVGVDQKTISTWWRNWETNHHIIEKAGKRGQFKKRYTLLELMIMYFEPGDSEKPENSD